MKLKEKLLKLIAEAHEIELTFIAEIDESERTKKGTFKEWSVKDEIVHIAAWKGIMCERFRAFQADQAPPAFDDWDAINHEIFSRHKEDIWSEAVEYLDLSYKQLVEQIHGVSEAELLDGERYPWLRGRSLFKQTIHNGYFHPQGHIAFWYSKRGDNERGNRLMEEVANHMQTLDESPAWRGQTIYNLACYYAQSGDKNRAIDRLGQAFPLNPEMIMWSKEDSDLASVWEEPGYLALIHQWKST